MGLPHRNALEADQGANSRLVLAPGKTVSLVTSISGSQNQQKWALDWLRFNLRQNGLKIADGQSVTVEARTMDGDLVPSPYVRHGSGGVETHSVRQKISTLQVKQAGKVIWDAKHVTNHPAHVGWNKGGNFLDALKRQHTPNLKFFKEISVPKWLYRPGEGKSNLTDKGIVNAH